MYKYVIKCKKKKKLSRGKRCMNAALLERGVEGAQLFPHPPSFCRLAYPALKTGWREKGKKSGLQPLLIP